MLLEQIAGFVEVAHVGNMRRAADILLISQPALSARIQGLEHELGVELFRRSSTGMTLTPAGKVFLPHAEQSLGMVRTGMSIVRSLEHGVDEDIVIGASRTVSAYVLPQVLMCFMPLHPNIGLTVRTSNSEAVVEMLLRGEIDLALTRELTDRGVSSKPLYDDDLAFVAHPDLYPARRGTLKRSDLRHVELIMFDRNSANYHFTTWLYQAAGGLPKRVLEVDNVETARRMAEHGLGLTLLPNTAVAESLSIGALRRFRLSDLTIPPRRFVATERSSAQRSEAMASFHQLLTQIPDIVPGATAPIR